MGDLLHALGATLKLKWVYDGKVQSGSYCSAQGSMLNIGSTAISMSTLVIAVHTFVVVWKGVYINRFLFPSIIVGAIWVYAVVFAAASVAFHNDPADPYYVPVPHWCWIGNHLEHRIFGQWLWMWSALLLSLILYPLLLFWTRGNITVSPEDPWWKVKLHRRAGNEDPRMRHLSYAMISYAVMYAIMVLPMSVVRWIKFVLDHQGGTSEVPVPATFTVVSLYHLIGVTNILLFFFTRKNVLGFKGNRPPAANQTRSISTASIGNNSTWNDGKDKFP